MSPSLTALTFSSNSNISTTPKRVTLAESLSEKFNFTCYMRISSPMRLRLYRIPSDSVSLSADGSAASPAGALVVREIPVQPPTYGVSTSYTFEFNATRISAGTYWCEIVDGSGGKSRSTAYSVLVYCAHLCICNWEYISHFCFRLLFCILCLFSSPSCNRSSPR